MFKSLELVELNITVVSYLTEDWQPRRLQTKYQMHRMTCAWRNVQLRFAKPFALTDLDVIRSEDLLVKRLVWLASYLACTQI